MKPLKRIIARQPDFQREALVQDALSLFSGQKAGHMGAWQYQKSLYKGDPAGGAALWAKFIRNSQEYYLFHADTHLIDAVKPFIKTALKGVKTVTEIGPGSVEAIRGKTLKLLDQAESNCRYVAIDCDEMTAKSAAEMVAVETGRITSALVEDAFQMHRSDEGKPAAIAVLGGTWANIQGSIGQSYHLRLAQLVQNYRSAMSIGDVLMTTFDTNMDVPTLDRAYNHPDHAIFGVSALHLMARECDIQGSFDPYQWRYEPVISIASHQVAHCVYPVRGQHFLLNGQEFRIQAGQHFVMNNSYKYAAADIERTMQAAGFDVQIVQLPENPMAMAIGRIS